MTDDSSHAGPPPPNGPHPVRSPHVGALVPAHVARGVFSTGVAVLAGSHEFLVDFLLQMQHPQQVVARVILPPPVVGQFLQALRENIGRYEQRFGAIVPAAAYEHRMEAGGGPAGAALAPQAGEDGADGASMPAEQAEELYDQLRLPDDVMGGRYANAVMIGHSPSEFSFDFIVTFYPRPVVVQRVFLSAPNVPRFMLSLQQSFDEFRRRMTQQEPPDVPPASSPEDP